ncbi:hypothetical protein B0T17DRAFT_308819 [Bombardia bombarda]|uniref:Secreted protein n=1 Tax=Bombardia bombarda TaxID=252184 RepID=A0AA40C2J0_9PEZI|nr:hypothetical protein B0T17DRAFT_308819 [Bombardia bombarda]
MLLIAYLALGFFRSPSGQCWTRSLQRRTASRFAFLETSVGVPRTVSENASRRVCRPLPVGSSLARRNVSRRSTTSQAVDGLPHVGIGGNNHGAHLGQGQSGSDALHVHVWDAAVRGCRGRHPECM